MNKRTRQLLGIASAVITYYFVHEGAHFLYAICTGVFKKINFMGIGMQVDVYADKMTNTQLGIFCLVGPVATADCGLGACFADGQDLQKSVKGVQSLYVLHHNSHASP